MKTSGVYCITNRVNGMRYVGSSVNIASRFNQHRSMLKAGEHHSHRLQRACDLFGLESFVLTVLEADVPRETLVSREQFYIDSTRPEYNIAKIAGKRPAMPVKIPDYRNSVPVPAPRTWIISLLEDRRYRESLVERISSGNAGKRLLKTLGGYGQKVVAMSETLTAARQAMSTI
jgi:hypothetical protein